MRYPFMRGCVIDYCTGYSCDTDVVASAPAALEPESRSLTSPAPRAPVTPPPPPSRPLPENRGPRQPPASTTRPARNIPDWNDSDAVAVWQVRYARGARRPQPTSIDEIDERVQRMNELGAPPGELGWKLVVRGFASPEWRGAANPEAARRQNIALAQERAAWIGEYLKGHLSYTVPICITSGAIDSRAATTEARRVEVSWTRDEITCVVTL